jgi:hypothetical protein
LAGVFLYQKLKWYYFLVASALAAGLAAGLVAGLALVSAGLTFPAAGFVSVLAVFEIEVVLLVCFGVVDVCAVAPNAMVAATNKSARLLMVFICFVF